MSALLRTGIAALGISALAAWAAAGIAGAQAPAPRGGADGAAIRTLQARLSDEEARFNARVDERLTEDTVEQGRLIAVGGSRDSGSRTACITCHGVGGQGDGSGAFPKLAGLPGWYMYKQLMDYASGDRPNQVMAPIAKELSEAEMEAVASYYALLEEPEPDDPIEQVDTDLQWGGQLAAIGSAEKGIPACVNCHGPQGTGMPPSVPYLAGQYAEYIALQLRLWKEGVRDNDAMNVMEAIATKMTEEDMWAVARYYERVRPVAGGDEVGNASDLPR